MFLWRCYTSLRMIQGVAAVGFNLITLVCFARYPFLRSSCHILLASLAMADLLHGMTMSVIFPIREFHEKWSDARGKCLSIIAPEGVFVFIQFAMFSLLSIERYLSLKSQLGQAHQLGTPKIRGLVSFSWFAITIWISLVAFYTPNVAENALCSINTFPSFFRVPSLIYIIISISTTAYFYSKILRIFINVRRQIAATSVNSLQVNRGFRQIVGAKIVCTVIGMFFVSYVPLMIMGSMVRYMPSSEIINFVYYMAVLLVDVNFWINPVIYAWRDKNFKKALDLLFRRFRRPARPTVTPKFVNLKPIAPIVQARSPLVAPPAVNPGNDEIAP